MTILDRNSGVFNTTTAFNVTRSSGNFGVGTVIVVAVFGNTIINTPGSATQRTTSVVDLGLYSYDIAGAGQSSIAFTNSTGCGIWHCWELSAGSTYVTGQAAQSASVPASTHTSPTITPSSGDRHLLVSVGGVTGGLSRSVSSVDSSFTITLASQQVAAQDWPFAAGAELNVTTAGGTGYSTTGTFSASISFAHGAIALAYSNAPLAAAAPPRRPTVLRQAVGFASNW